MHRELRVVKQSKGVILLKEENKLNHMQPYKSHWVKKRKCDLILPFVYLNKLSWPNKGNGCSKT